jgi:hypothetical protein
MVAHADSLNKSGCWLKKLGQCPVFFYLCANIPDMKNFLYSNGYASAFDPLDSVSGRGLVPLGVR